MRFQFCEAVLGRPRYPRTELEWMVLRVGQALRITTWTELTAVVRQLAEIQQRCHHVDDPTSCLARGFYGASIKRLQAHNAVPGRSVVSTLQAFMNAVSSWPNAYMPYLEFIAFALPFRVRRPNREMVQYDRGCYSHL